jgi:hypothetical protein
MALFALPALLSPALPFMVVEHTEKKISIVYIYITYLGLEARLRLEPLPSLIPACFFRRSG